MLTNQFYVGMVSSPKWQTTHAGEHPPLIDRETFDRVQAILSGRRTAVVPHLRNRDDFPLRNFVRCGACQRPLTGSIVKEKYAYYYCPNSGCRAAKARREVFETAFIRFLEEQQPQPAYLKLFAAVVRDVWRRKNREAEEALTACRQQIRSLKDRREKLIDAMLDGRLTEFEARERLDRLNDDIVAAEAVEKEKHIDQLDVEAVLAYAERLLLNTARLWLDANLDQKQRLQRVIFPKGLEFIDGSFKTPRNLFTFQQLTRDRGSKSKFGVPNGIRTRISLSRNWPDMAGQMPDNGLLNYARRSGRKHQHFEGFPLG